MDDRLALMSNTRIKEPHPFAVRGLKMTALLISRFLWRLEFRGEENIPEQVPHGFVIAANHQTYVDPVWISIPIKRRIGFLAWDKALGWPVLGPLMRYLGAVPVNTSSGRNAASWKALLETLDRGGAVLIFPEGAREFADGEMFAFKSGAARLAIEAGVPILPVTVTGGNTAWPQGHRWPRPAKVRITFHPLIETPACNSADEEKSAAREVTERLRTVISSVRGQCQ